MTITAVVLTAIVIALIREVGAPSAVMLTGLIVLVLTGIVPVQEAFAGLASPATLSIAGLFIVARAVRDHAGLDRSLARALGDGSLSVQAVLARYVPATILLSGFANNTPIVAVGAPVLRNWAEKHGVATSKLLMPLSFAAILGGMLTLIGTGPNLVVSAMLTDAGHAPLGFFELTPIGLPVAAVGGVLLVLLAPKLLADRRTPHEQLASHQRDYTLRVTVEPEGPLDGTTIADAGLRDLPGGFIAGVLPRGGDTTGPASPHTRLRGGDELVLVGNITIVQAALERPGLREPEHPQARMFDRDDALLAECVLSPGSELVGRSLKQVAFRGRYGGAVIAVHRAGTRLEGKLGSIELRPGDTLLVLADPTFTERWTGHRDFAAVIPHSTPAVPPRQQRDRTTTLAIFVGMIALAATGLVPAVHAILAASLLLVITRTISFGRAIAALDLDILLIVASAIGLGTAITASGLTAEIGGLVTNLADTDPAITIVLLAATTILLTELITNVAAAALMLPIGLELAALTGTDVRTTAIAVAIAASASFLTPLGYQTNTIVYGIGGYRYTDYWRLGLPLTLSTLLILAMLQLR